MEQQLIEEIGSTGRELLQIIDRFPQETFNTIPFAGSWTPGQVTEHILLSAQGVLRTVNGGTGPADRDPRQFIAPIREAFLNFDIKFQSPDFILPSDEPKEKQPFLATTRETWEGLAAAAKRDDLTAICVDFEMPTIGLITKLEWLSFIVVHAQRHIWQMKKILAYIGLPA